MGMRPLYERQAPLKIALQDEWGPLQHRVRHALRGGSVLARDLGLLMVSCLRGARVALVECYMERGELTDAHIMAQALDEKNSQLVTERGSSEVLFQ